MHIESIGDSIVIIGVVVHREYKIVRAVVLEGGGEGERVPSLLTVQAAGIYLLEAGSGDIVGSPGEAALGGVSQIDGHVVLLRGR